MHADLPSEDMRRREIGDPLEPNPHRALPGYTDWIRQNGGELRCEVLSVQPELVLKWRYTKEQEELCKLGAVGQYGYMPHGCPNGGSCEESQRHEFLEILKMPCKLWSVTQRAPDTRCL